MNKKFFGAKAKVYIEYDGDLNSLTKKLGEDLNLNNIYSKNDHDEPYEPVVMCEVLGFEIWIRKSELNTGFQYQLEIESDVDIENRIDNEMFDLSPWLGKYLKINSGLNTGI